MRIAIIPARGGSKRIPHKNVKLFCKRPIIAYSIEAARESGLFDEVMVSTDEAEIASLAERLGASVPFLRSEKNSDDHATTADVLIEVLGQYQQKGAYFDQICCIYPCAPFVTAEKLRNALCLWETSEADALVPVVRFSYPPMRGLVIKDDRLAMKWPEYADTRSQDLEPLYHDAGQFYFIKKDALEREKTLLCKGAVPVVVPELEAQDIDGEEDWRVAEWKYKWIKYS